MPVDNLARDRNQCYIAGGPYSAISFALHGVMDCSIPQHAAGCLGNWHTLDEDLIDKKLEEYMNDANRAKFQKEVLALVDKWSWDDPAATPAITRAGRP